MRQAMPAPKSPHFGLNAGRFDRCLPRSGSTIGYSIIEDEDGPALPRISAVNACDIEIAGAYQPPHAPYWLMYVTPQLAAIAGVDFRPDRLRLRGRDEARQWVDFVAHLYEKAAS